MIYERHPQAVQKVRPHNRFCSLLCGPSFYVFSDDINWCREHFIGNEYHFVDCNNGLNSWRDLYLMSLCRHHINSNSTFSWWGAWLCEYDDKIVITPEEYIKDLSTPDVYPAEWIKL